MNWLASVSTGRPKTVLLIMCAATIMFCSVLAREFVTDLNPNPNPMDSIARDMDSLRYYYLVKKKFSLKDVIIIGIENRSGGVYSPATLRYVEQLTDRLRRVKAQKSHRDLITGKQEMLEVPGGIEGKGIQSILNARDPSRDRGTGRIVSTTAVGIANDREGSGGRLPTSDEELARILPTLEKEVTASPIHGMIVSPDKKSCALIVPLESRVEYRHRIIKQELPCMIDAERMMNRFLGRDGYFPLSLYNKNIGGVTITDAYVRKLVARNRIRVKNYFLNMFAGAKSHYGNFYENISGGDTDRAFSAALKMIESDGLYEIEDAGMIYEDTINDLYDFVIVGMDPISRNILESKIYSLAAIYDSGSLYRALMKITGENRPSSIRTFIAGSPVEEHIIQDTVRRELPVIIAAAVAVIFLAHLIFSRSIGGAFIPLAVGAVSGIWACGGMALAGMKPSFWTAPALFIITAAGSLPVFHFVSRYLDNLSRQENPDRRESIALAMKRIGRSITCSIPVAAALFLALFPAPVSDVSRLAIAASSGLAIAALLSATGVPALLSLLPVPARISINGPQRFVTGLAVRAGNFGLVNYRMITAVSAILTALSIYGLVFTRAESGISSHFHSGSAISAATMFVNDRFPGTTALNIVITMKDSVDLATRPIRKILVRRIDAFIVSYRTFLIIHPDLQRAEQLNRFFMDDLVRMKRNPQKNQNAIEKRLAIFNDMLNENYVLHRSRGEKEATRSDTTEEEDELISIPDLSDFSGFGQAETPKTPLEEGLSNIMKRISTIKTKNDRIAGKEHIIAIRQYKNGATAAEMLRNYKKLTDLFRTDIIQPLFLRKADALVEKIRGVNGSVPIPGATFTAQLGPIISITDYIKHVYKKVYHDNNPAFNKIPDLKRDRFTGPKLTDRTMTGACLGLVRTIWPGIFSGLITKDMKMLQNIAFLRGDRAETVSGVTAVIQLLAGRLFPDLDPYVQKVAVTGIPVVHRELNGRLTAQLLRWAALAGAAAFLCCCFIMRSPSRGMILTIPLILPAVSVLGIMGWAGIPISYGTAPVSGLAIVSQVYFTMACIESIQRGKDSSAGNGEKPITAAIAGAGRYIVIPGLSLACGLAILGISSSKIASSSALMAAAMMFLNMVAALMVVPAFVRLVSPAIEAAK